MLHPPLPRCDKYGHNRNDDSPHQWHHIQPLKLYVATARVRKFTLQKLLKQEQQKNLIVINFVFRNYLYPTLNKYLKFM